MPPWLAHLFHWQRGPVPWQAVFRGALSAGPLLFLAALAGHPAAGVLAGVGAMLAGVNDRPGTRRTGIAHIGVPALAGASGILLGSVFAALVASGWWAVPLLFAVGLVSGAVSVSGPVLSAAGMQLTVATAVGAGMPLPGEPWLEALCFLGGAGWLLLLRVLLRTPGARAGALDGERAAVAGVYEALADALEAAGRPGAEAARRRLTTALDRADEALRMRRVLRTLRRSGRVEEALLAGRFAAATALCEASVALLWEGRPLSARVAEGPRRLAAAARTGALPGRLPAPASGSPARTSFDRALFEAAQVFARTEPATATPPHALDAAVRRRSRRGRMLGAAGREYGLRVAVTVSAATAAAQPLSTAHWYWLPATAAFLVKPDMGPLFSRTVSRFAGTVVGVLLFQLLWLLGGVPWWPVIVAGAAGAAVPIAGRHFAGQTTVVTVMVLAMVFMAGDTQAAGARVTHTAIACGLALLVGHLPLVFGPGARVGHRFVVGLRLTEEYVRLALAAGPDDTESVAHRRALRRAAYRALAEARGLAETASAELPWLRGRMHEWLPAMATAERVVDAATACAVRLANGAPPPEAGTAEETVGILAGAGRRLEERRAFTRPGAPARERRALGDAAERLRGVGVLTPAA